MKILHVIPSVAPVRGGPSQAVLEMVRELRSQGINADIATTNDNGDGVLNVPFEQSILYPQPESSHSVPVRFFPKFAPQMTSLREFTFSGGLTTWLWQTIAQYDLVHVHAIFSYPSTAAMAIARMQQVPYIVRPLGQLCHWSLQQRSRKKQLYLQFIERTNLQSSRALHFTSEQEKREATSLGLKTPGFILPHGLSLPQAMADARQVVRAQFNLAPEEPIILFMSRLHPKKGLDVLIAALSQLKDYRFTLVVAGNGTAEYEAEIERLLVDTGIHHRTRRVGFVSGAMKQQLLQGSDMFVLPSHSENFGIAVLEALAAGLPAVVTPGVALSDTVQRHHVGWVVNQTPGAIATTLSHIFRNPQLAHRMGTHARQVVRDHFTWNRVAANLIDHYETVLRQEPILNPAFQ